MQQAKGGSRQGMAMKEGASAQGPANAVGTPVCAAP
jgi:hypothetical protein